MNTESGYIRIYQGMLSRLRLQGYPLLLFGLITGYTESGKRWRGSLSYTAACLDTSRAVICRSLQVLLDAGYIVKYESHTGNGIQRYEYASRYPELLAQWATVPAYLEQGQRRNQQGALARVGQPAVLP